MPKGSKGHVGNGVLVESANKKTNSRKAGALTRWEKALSKVALFYFPGKKPAIEELPVRVKLLFRLPAENAKGTDPTKHGTGDVDKLARAVLDALEGIAYANDAQVCALDARKEFDHGGQGPGVYITVTDL